MLGHRYRFKVKNETGQTIAANSLFVYARRWKFAQDGSLVFEASEATLLTNSNTLANGAFLAGTVQDNTSDKWIGGSFTFVVTAPASSNGNVILYFENTTDDSSARFPSDGFGRVVVATFFNTSGTRQVDFTI